MVAFVEFNAPSARKNSPGSTFGSNWLTVIFGPFLPVLNDVGRHFPFFLVWNFNWKRSARSFSNMIFNCF